MIHSDILTGASDKHICYMETGVGIHNAMLKDWQALTKAANKAGFNLAIASGFRSFDRQLSIWNRKFTGELPVKSLENERIDLTNLPTAQQIKAVMTFSALPAASRHHWGTDVDIYDPSALSPDSTLQLEPWEYEQGGPFEQLTDWLADNLENFGFYFPYDKYRGGVAAEPWHISYFPLANTYQQALTKEVILAQIERCDIEAKSYIIKNLDQLLTTYVYNVGTSPCE